VATRKLGIIMNGVTGRMGLNQHLVRSILAIREQGGVTLPNGDRVMPDPILVGRNAEKIAALGKQYGIARTTTDLAAALKNPDDTIFFDAATTQMRADLVTQAINAGKHIYCEKPSAASFKEAMAVYRAAKKAGIRHGVNCIEIVKWIQDPNDNRAAFVGLEIPWGRSLYSQNDVGIPHRLCLGIDQRRSDRFELSIKYP
jgi:hypothetical protein